MKRQPFLMGLVIWGLTSLIVSALIVVSSSWRVAINVTPSLPGHVYLIDLKDKTPVTEGLIAFRARAMQPIPNGVTVIKVVRGIAGDLVTVTDRQVEVNGRWVAYAKPTSRTGEPLVPSATQTIPNGRIFVYAPHPDSFDSRYAVPGLIDESQIIGRAYELF